ncbi:MAG TPA: alpha/beta hydrolase [Devosia sp.]|nr:alpha/beta hydrolase [Devosia sp.]
MGSNSQTLRAQILDAPLEPELERFLTSIRESVAQSAGSAPDVLALRQASRRARLGWSLSGPTLDTSESQEFGMLTRNYSPPGARSDRLLIYLHGGGWAMLDLDTHDRLMRAYALRSAWNIIALDYPLAPETRFPQSLAACTGTIEHIIENVGAAGLKPENIVLGGDSSGANLALCVELDRQRRGEPSLGGLLLNYGVYDSDLTRSSYRRFVGAPYLLSAERMEFFWSQYCASRECRQNPRAAPLRAEPALLAKLPPVHLTIAAQDVLVDENLLFSDRLNAAGVAVTRRIYAEAAHAFLEAVDCSPVADRAIANGSDWLGGL